MTRLKIEVAANTDEAARVLVDLLVYRMREGVAMHYTTYAIKQPFGTATVRVEREETTEAI